MLAKTMIIGRRLRPYRRMRVYYPSGDNAQPAVARLFSRRFLQDYIITMRPYLLFVSGITGIAGLSLTANVPAFASVLLVVAFFLSYGFGQALTDCYQVDTDSLSAPYRPLVRGVVRRRDVMAVSLIGLTAIGLLFAVCNPINIALAGLAVLGLATYTPFKRRWWAGPFYNAWIVAVLAAIAYACGLGLRGDAADSAAAVVATLTAVFFGYANFVLAGYFKDVSADRATGYRTLPVVFGFAKSARVSDVFAAIAIVATAAAVVSVLGGVPLELRSLPVLGFLVAGIAATTLAQVRLHSVRKEAQAYHAIAPVVHAYILLLSAIAAAAEPRWWAGLALFYLAFELAMRRRPMNEQI